MGIFIAVASKRGSCIYKPGNGILMLKYFIKTLRRRHRLLWCNCNTQNWHVNIKLIGWLVCQGEQVNPWYPSNTVVIELSQLCGHSDLQNHHISRIPHIMVQILIFSNHSSFPDLVAYLHWWHYFLVETIYTWCFQPYSHGELSTWRRWYHAEMVETPRYQSLTGVVIPGKVHVYV